MLAIHVRILDLNTGDTDTAFEFGLVVIFAVTTSVYRQSDTCCTISLEEDATSNNSATTSEALHETIWRSRAVFVQKLKCAGSYERISRSQLMTSRMLVSWKAE